MVQAKQIWAAFLTRARSGKNKSAVPSTPAAFAALTPARRSALLAGEARVAFRCVRMLAEAGIIEAQLRFGRMLLEGRGCDRNEARALAWFMTAARDGDIEAMNMVGRCHENGWGTGADMQAAALWYERAAIRGDAWAQYNFGHLLLDGNGVVQDKSAAFEWYMRAAQQGHARAMNLVARCLEQGWGTARDPRAALAWYRQSSEGGYFRGQYNYATLLLAEGRATEGHELLMLAKKGWGSSACPPRPPVTI
jgi:TPR repeat protein